MRKKVIEAIENNKIIAILRGIESDKLIPLAEAMYNGGIRLLEITFSADKNESDEKTAKNIEKLVSHFGDRMHIGAGTVLTEGQAELVKLAGGKFIISPDTNTAVIKKTRELGLVSIPGALTPTEIAAAHRAGADFVKLFPVSALGAEYVKAVKAPLSHVKLLAVGGINEENMADYLAAGVCGFGIGSNIADKKLISSNSFDKITALVEKYVSALRRV
jgi:2-dehydro-3-deoxyphosphogluconate aldolase/(4S)-4-hydroxy-2-oxoglutarate aldolase